MTHACTVPVSQTVPVETLNPFDTDHAWVTNQTELLHLAPPSKLHSSDAVKNFTHSDTLLHTDYAFSPHRHFYTQWLDFYTNADLRVLHQNKRLHGIRWISNIDCVHTTLLHTGRESFYTQTAWVTHQTELLHAKEIVVMPSKIVQWRQW